jgi:iron complex transport system permease protein
MILAGVAVGSFTSAVTSFMMLRGDNQVQRALSFLMGGSPVAGWEPVKIALPYMVVGSVLLIFSGHALNVLQFGEEQARQLGLPVERVKGFVIVAASLTAAGAVSFSGVIGFIGLIVPHLVRILWGGDYRRLIPLSVIGGGTFLLLADVVARIALAPQSLPVGIVTALVGAPFFLWILKRAKKKVFW